MRGPALLPKDLICYESYSTDRELVQALSQKHSDLITFFECACHDKQWRKGHQRFLRLVLRWGAAQFYLGNLSWDDARRLVKIIQIYCSLLEPFLLFQPALFFTIKVLVEHQEILVNSLLFGVSSPLLGRMFKQEFEKLNNRCVLPHISLSLFRVIEIYVSRGEIQELKKYQRADILVLMNLAKAWEIEDLVNDCATILKLSE